MAVAGDPENRTGVVVAKNELAKAYGVRTADTVWQARRKCPEIVFVPPRHHYYREISERVNRIYREYTDYVEPASIDESYLDMTGAPGYFGRDPRRLADTLRARVRDGIGITISVGVSYNKIFAKMGSDYRKPDATTVITPDNYRDILWPLPVSDLMFAGRSAAALLNRKSVFTVGDLAKADPAQLREWLGRGGEQLWLYANGQDDSPVRLWGDVPQIKSVSRGRTCRRDLTGEREVLTGISELSDHVARTLRRHGLKGCVIQVQIKTPELRVISRQISLDHYTCLHHEIRDVSMQLIKTNWQIGQNAPIRALTVGVTGLVPADRAAQQTSLFDLLSDAREDAGSGKLREKQEKLEAAVDTLRRKYGDGTITLGFREQK